MPHRLLMRERRAGTIVNVRSLAGLIARPFVGMYCATKFATEGASEALRRPYAPAPRCCAAAAEARRQRLYLVALGEGGDPHLSR
jgi:NAD(P)-dependent dehydrogenase (short-subunit alcohol dehydrogenase family)